ncbi:hypothetical protein LSM04_004662 [Trypanosoma melophagium]|uniref:uncharacterized protein n=1 Tax=Trypanosoma melophagium TaxID=715481 RepID=UPI00351AB0F6|nr:hypothetical protein LSM04_004662 [Trypanosoma melophagium]
MEISFMNAFQDTEEEQSQSKQIHSQVLLPEEYESPLMEMNESEMRELEYRIKHKLRLNAVVSETVPCKRTCRPYPHPKTREERVMLINMLTTFACFAHLPEYRLQMIVDAFERCVVAPGEIIKTASGDNIHEFYWIECGSVVSTGCASSTCASCYYDSDCYCV